ncbi:MAG: hypothetical protein AB9842_12775 [Bacteroidales bacterium]
MTTLKNIVPPAVLLLLLIVFMAGCGGTAQKSEKLTRLDSLEKALLSMEKSLKKINPEQVKETYVDCKENLQKIYMVFHKDPLAVEEDLLIQYERVNVGLNRLVLELDNAEKEIQFGIQQIASWKNSVIKGDASNEEFDHYCRLETAAIHSLELLMVSKASEWKKLQEKIKMLNPQVNKLR